MKDQAEKLRMKLQEQDLPMGKTIAVVSGKGGVGKSNISINTAMILTKKGYKVLLFDLDVGMGNVNILLGRSSPTTLSDFLQQSMPLEDIIYSTPEGVSYISAGNGLNEVMHINDYMLEKLLSGLRELQVNYDYIIFDMAAGATAASLKILMAADDIFVVSTPEPTAITDAYSMMKFITLEKSTSRFLLICNRADSEKQGKEALDRLQQTALKFLEKIVIILGVLPEDGHVRKAVLSQTAFTNKYPNSPITLKLEKIVHLYLQKANLGALEEKESFIHKLRRFFIVEVRK
ncbi:MinD/ParA family protein [Lederbergia citrea]|uniref:MinD/ParA family protein n=1 Tax=Lederbergia citrea TaxID=2833581 RepID=UPI001BC91C16|nr:MinD/ParA family protein [Lederbergia citrea]MBS4203766.1 MinD/ParA family protein [Lederbergia citrea]